MKKSKVQAARAPQPSSIAVKMVLTAEERAVGLQEMLEKGVELLI
jgi:hypothetical protein